MSVQQNDFGIDAVAWVHFSFDSLSQNESKQFAGNGSTGENVVEKTKQMKVFTGSRMHILRLCVASHAHQSTDVELLNV